MDASPPPSSKLTPSTDAWAAIPHAVPRAVDADIAGSRGLGPRHRVLSDVFVYTGAGDPAASSSEADAPAAPASSSSDNAAADSSVLEFLSRVFGSAFSYLVVLFVLFSIAILVVLLVKLATLATAYVADRCATAWRSIVAAREKATRVRPVDEDAAAVAGA